MLLANLPAQGPAEGLPSLTGDGQVGWRLRGM